MGEGVGDSRRQAGLPALAVQQFGKLQRRDGLEALHQRRHRRILPEGGQGAAVEVPGHVQVHAVELLAEALGQVLAAVEVRGAGPGPVEPEGADGHQGHVEEVLEPGRRQQQQRPAGRRTERRS